ncbi:hypothetical protein [Flavobacterium sp. UBA7680]|uniref:hypothetical protein n=1 Tax=Flavobacterium sp. UBA7680 TaxID=1946559 RepID=UPI0025C4030C|nr:hypothetical protein [Flavobacterium sp. UBA7680]
MATQTLNTIKNWFKTGLKPTQNQFWDTWDSFRHKNEKIPTTEITGIDELLGEISAQIPNINGSPNSLTKIELDSNNILNLAESNISDTGEKITIDCKTEIDSKVKGKIGLKFTQLKNEFTTHSEIVFDNDIAPTAGIDGTAYIAYGNIVKKVNLDKKITDYYSFPEGNYIQGTIIVNPNNGDLYLEYLDGNSKYNLVKFDHTGVLSVLRSSTVSYYHMGIDKSNNIYLREHASQRILKINTITLNTIDYYTGDLKLTLLGFDLEANSYFYDYETYNLIYKLNSTGQVSHFTTVNFEIRTGCVKPDGSLYIISNDYDDKNIYSIDKFGTTTLFTTLPYTAFYPVLLENGSLYVNNNDYYNGLVYKISPTGEVILFGTAGSSPRYMAVTNSEIVYVSNSASYNVIKISPNKAQNLLTLDEEGNIILYDKEIAAKSDFKTINGESILGSGDIEISNGDGMLEISVNGYLPDSDGNITLPSASATVTGLVNDTSLQELGGTDKMINGIRIGKGNANYENNLVIGRNGLASITTGKYNVAIGNGDGDVEGPLQYLTTGNNNTMVGSDAGVNNSTGGNNTGIGAASLFSNTTGVNNTAVGAFALTKNQTSPYNVAIGDHSLAKMVSGLGQSTAIGSYCMSDATSTDKNAAIGTYALRYNTSGFSNTAIGHTALGLNTSGSSNTALGNYSLGAITTGAGNIGVGKSAGRYITTGISNIYIGSEGVPTDAEASGIVNIGNRFIAKGTKVSLTGILNIGTTPIYENNTTALAGGLTAGDVYRTSTGILMITF